MGDVLDRKRISIWDPQLQPCEWLRGVSVKGLRRTSEAQTLHTGCSAFVDPKSRADISHTVSFSWIWNMLLMTWLTSWNSLSLYVPSVAHPEVSALHGCIESPDRGDPR